MLTHSQAKQIVDALPGLTGYESLFVRAVAWHETNYGQGWKAGEGAGSFNMGAVTTSAPNALSFKHVDSRFDDKLGHVREYVTWFAGYNTADEGFFALATLLLEKDEVRAALRTNDFLEGVTHMYEHSYFLGLHTHANQNGDRLNIEDYYLAVVHAIETIGAETGEEQPDVLDGVVA